MYLGGIAGERNDEVNHAGPVIGVQISAARDRRARRVGMIDSQEIESALARIDVGGDQTFPFGKIKLGAGLLVDERGQLSRAIETASPNLARLKAVHEEMCAQVDLLASLGVPISHFDSHNHIHTKPFMFPALKAVQKRYGMRKVRISKNLYAPGQPMSQMLRWKKRAYNWALRNIYQTRTTDAFTELLSFCEASRTKI